MKTKEEILAKRIVKFPEEDFNEHGYGTMTDESIKRNVYACMEEYAQSVAKQQAIAFDKWKADRNIEVGFNLHGELEYNDPSYHYSSPDQLYAQFIESQNKEQ